jgi:hypothetical protein
MSRSVLTRAILDEQFADLGLPPYDGDDLAAASLVAALAAYDRSAEPHRAVLKAAVKYLLDALVTAVPGKSVEVRVPPYAAVQCVEGPRHTRGTPPNVVEMNAATWIAVATGRLHWADAIADGRVRASGSRADLTPYLPVTPAG